GELPRTGLFARHTAVWTCLGATSNERLRTAPIDEVRVAMAIGMLGEVLIWCESSRRVRCDHRRRRSCMPHEKKVLMIGLDPKVVDYAHLVVKLDEPTLRASLAADEQRLRDLGYDANWLLIDRGETAESVVLATLEEKVFDCVLIGAGI